MALLTFLEQNGLSGKEVYLFCSHGTGGLARSVELITEAETAANISGNIFDCYEEASGPGWRTWGMVRTPQGTRRVQMEFDGGTVVYQPNDSATADAPLVQLSLTTEAEDYSTNEKIFYPPQVLDATDTPPAEGGAGSPAYYAPWGDVVMFCKDLLSER